MPQFNGMSIRQLENMRTDDLCLFDPDSPTGHKKHRIKPMSNPVYGDCLVCENCKKFFDPTTHKRLDSGPGPTIQDQRKNLNKLERDLGIASKGEPR